MINLDSSLFKVVSIIADLIAIGTLFTVIPYALLKKNDNLIAFRISQFLHYFLRTGIIIFSLWLLYYLVKVGYLFFVVIAKGAVSYDNMYWEDGYEIQHILAYCIFIPIWLSLSWMIGTFIWTSSFNSAKEFLNLFLPKDKLLSKQKPTLEILNAVYKTDKQSIDVTSIARQMVADNTLTIKASNELAGDPHPWNPKVLVINYRIGQRTEEVYIPEGETKTISLTS